MAKKLKKAFTITELVIVIAVVAILAAVLIPTFANIIDKANESSDMQAVREMNLALENSEAFSGKPSSVSEAMDILEAENLDARNYKALSKNHVILYNFKANVVVYLNLTTNKIEYPNGLDLEYGDATIGEWYKLDGRLQGDTTWQNAPVISLKDDATILERNDEGKYPKETRPTGIIKEGDKIVGAKVDTAAKLVSVVEYLESGELEDEGFTLILGDDIKMENSEWKPISEYAGSFYGNGHTIRNLQISDFTAEAKPFSASTPNTNYYYYGFISVFTGSYFGDVTFENIVIDRPGHTMNIGNGSSRNNHTVGGAIGGIVAPARTHGGATINIANVTVTGTIHAYRRGGGIVGYIGGYQRGENETFAESQMNGTVNIKNCVNGATITTDGIDQYGTVGGILSTTNQRQAEAQVNISGCTNTGNLSGVRVGGIIGDVHSSSAYNSDGGTITITGCVNDGKVAASSKVSSNDGWNAAGGIFGFIQTNSNPKYVLNISGCENNGEIADESGTNSVWLGAIIGGGEMHAEMPTKIEIHLGTGETANKNTFEENTSSYFNNKLSGDFTFTSSSAADKKSFRVWLKEA